MKTALNILGCILYITGIVFIIVYFRVMILYTTDYLIFGSHEYVQIEQTISGKDDLEFTYHVKVLSSAENQQTFISSKTSQKYYDGQIVRAMVSPTFKIVMFGHLVTGSYITGMLLLFFLIISFVVLCKQLFFRKEDGLKPHLPVLRSEKLKRPEIR